MRASGLVSICVLTGAGLVSTLNASTVTGMVIFGDSLSDTGNTATDTTLALGGETGGLLAGLPQTELPYAPFYQNGLFTDGPSTSPSSTLQGVWVQQLAPKLGLPVPTNSLAGGTDYAFAGAETGSGTAYKGIVQNMGMQLEDFCGGTCTAVSSGNLYVLFGGANDILDNPTNPIPAANTAAANIMSYIGMLASAGGTEFLWPNLPPMGELPNVAALGPLAQAAANAAAVTFNSDEATDIAQLEASHPGITIVGVNTFGLFQSIALDPGAYGFTNTTVPAANFLNGNQNVNPDTYLFWDGEHPTTAGHAALAGLAASDYLAAVPEPATIALAGMGLAGVLLWRRRAA